MVSLAAKIVGYLLLTVKGCHQTEHQTTTINMVNVQGYTSSSPTNEKQMAEDELYLRKSPVRKNEDCHIRATSGSDSGTMAGASRASESSTSNNESSEKKAVLADNIVDLTTDTPLEGSRRGAPRISTNLQHYHCMRGKGKLPVPSTQDVGTSSISILGPEPTTCCLSERTRYLTDLAARPESGNEASVSRSEATDVVESAQLSFGSSSSGREETVRLTHAREGEDLAVPNSVQHISTQSEKVLPIKRRRSSLMNPSNVRQRFKPPRLLHDRHVSGSTSGAMQTPIEVDDLESPCAGPHSNSRYRNMQNQIDEDEMLAKFLQEEYSLQDGRESPLMDDAQLARLLQEEENAIMQQPLQSTFHTDDVQFAWMLEEGQSANMRWQPQSSFRSPNALAVEETRREAHRVLPSFRPPSGTPTASSSRMRILRNLHNRSNQRLMRGHRLGGRAVNATESLYHFPEGVDLDTRLDLLGAMESASQGILPLLAGVDRDFNENDYEMLLALDGDDNSYRGASYSQIEQLPVSVIKPTDVCEETCSICLEIPVVGNLVRRLPCMHGFHQQCIDVWLQRQANCPICKVNL